MKIAVLVPNMDIGGVQTFAASITKFLSSNTNYQIDFIVFSGVLDNKYGFLNKLKGVKLHFLHKKSGFSLSFLIKLKSLLKRIGPDIINTHSSRTLRYLFLLRFCQKIKIAHVVTNNPQIYNKKLFWLYKKRLHQKSWSNLQIIGISDTVSAIFSSVYKYPLKKIRTIYNGVEYPPFKGNQKKVFDFVTCGSLIPIKNQSLLLRSFASLKSKTSTLAILGDGPLMEELKKEAIELNIYDRICFFGRVENPFEILLKSKIFILTSLSEGNPISIVEAMSQGLPIVAPSVGGIPDLIKDGTNGRLFCLNSMPCEIGLIMDKMIDMPEKDYYIVSNNNIKAATKWNIRTIGMQYINLFEELLK